MIKRRKTIQVRIGSLRVGSENPVYIESMTNTDTVDVNATVRQINRLDKFGCDIIRVAVVDDRSAEAFGIIKKKVNIPVVADIQFDPVMAVKAIEQGADGVRINPGNIKKKDDIKRIVDSASENNVPIRVGANSGSYSTAKFGKLIPENFVKSALYQIEILEKQGFKQILVSLKSSDPVFTVEVNELFSNMKKYPLHIGVTEAGTKDSALLKSGFGLGYLLYKGIGDTLRISIADKPEHEVIAGKKLLRYMGIREKGIEVIACPTCSRTKFDVSKIARKIEDEFINIDKNIKIAVMGCIVNGPGEARKSDIGFIGNNKGIVLYLKGKKADIIKENDVLARAKIEVELF